MQERLKKALAIPVVPLAFTALEVEHNEVDEKEREKRKEKQARRKQAKKANAPSTTSNVSGHAKTPPPLHGTVGDGMSGLAREAANSISTSAGTLAGLLQLLIAFVAYLQTLLGLGGPKKKKKKAMNPTAEIAPKSDPPGETSAPRPAPPRPKHREEASSALPAEADVSPAATTAIQAKAADTLHPGNKPMKANSAAIAAAVVADEDPKARAIAPNGGAPPSDGKRKPQLSAAAEGSVKAKANGPRANWERAQYAMAEVDGAHSDVIASVALSKDIALSAGYDGAIKVQDELRGGCTGDQDKPMTLCFPLTFPH